MNRRITSVLYLHLVIIGYVCQWHTLFLDGICSISLPLNNVMKLKESYCEHVMTVCVLLCVGLCPDWDDWDPWKARSNATEAMDAAEKWLNVPQVFLITFLTNTSVHL